ncbi:MAG: uroporphyrinogen decarboxylase family protein [Armatimonadia bacterium]
MPMDFAAHNEEQAAVWAAYQAGKPTRVPMTLGISSRYTIFNPVANPEGYDFEDFFTKPEAMYRHLLRKQYYIKHYLPYDQPMGLPEQWTVGVDLQNSYEALWFGCPLHFRPGQVPDTTPILDEDNKRRLFDRGVPDPFEGWLGRAWEYLEQFQEWAKDDEFEGRPVVASGVPGCGTDGIFTIACALMDPTALMLQLYTDPDFVHELLDYITEAVTARIVAYRKRLGIPLESKATGMADDAIQMLSPAHYREFVLPYHKRLVERFGAEGPNSIHLCGDATRHFKTIRDELKVMSFDTGFPVDHGWLREELGPEVTIYGGPHVELVLRGPVEAIVAETRRILGSGIMAGGKFVLREGNNLAPFTPPEHVRAMYEACREFGGY